MLTRWAIALQGFDFTVVHIPGKLHVVPDTLSRLFGEVTEDSSVGSISNPAELPSHIPLASICRNPFQLKEIAVCKGVDGAAFW